MAINPFQAISKVQKFVKNPVKTITQEFINRQMAAWRQQDPSLYRRIEKMTAGKGKDELIAMARNIAKEQGVDLDEFAAGFGIKL